GASGKSGNANEVSRKTGGADVRPSSAVNQLNVVSICTSNHTVGEAERSVQTGILCVAHGETQKVEPVSAGLGSLVGSGVAIGGEHERVAAHCAVGNSH